MIPVKALVSEEEFASSFLRLTVKLVNCVWLLASVHRRTQAARLLLLLGKALLPWLPFLARILEGKRAA